MILYCSRVLQALLLSNCFVQALFETYPSNDNCIYHSRNKDGSAIELRKTSDRCCATKYKVEAPDPITNYNWQNIKAYVIESFGAFLPESEIIRQADVVSHMGHRRAIKHFCHDIRKTSAYMIAQQSKRHSDLQRPLILHCGKAQFARLVLVRLKKVLHIIGFAPIEYSYKGYCISPEEAELTDEELEIKLREEDEARLNTAQVLVARALVIDDQIGTLARATGFDRGSTAECVDSDINLELTLAVGDSLNYNVAAAERNSPVSDRESAGPK